MESKNVSELAKQVRGVSDKPEDLHDGLNDKSVILLRANNINDGKINFDDVVYVDKSKVSKEQYLQNGDILICASSGSKQLVGKAASVDFDIECTFGAFCKVVRPNPSIAEFLGIYFQSNTYRQKVSEVAIGANINNIRNEHIDNLILSVGTDEENSEIVRMMKVIQRLIDERKQEVQELDKLVKARFIEVFGDMLLNSKSWREIRLDSVADIVSGITKGRKIKSAEIYEVPYMAVSNVKNGYIDWTKVKTIMATKEEIKRYQLLPNDVLMTEGGDPDKLGRGAVIKSPPNNCIHQNHIFRVRLNEEILPIYFEYYLQQIKAKRYFLKCSKQTTGIASINMKQLMALPVLIPDMESQKTFAKFTEQADKSKFINKRVDIFSDLCKIVIKYGFYRLHIYV